MKDVYRCRYNQLYLQISLVSVSNRLREGVITGESRDGKVCYVLWDGRTSKDSIAKAFLEILNTNIEEKSVGIKLKMIPPPLKKLPYQFSYLPETMEEKAYKQLKIKNNES